MPPKNNLSTTTTAHHDRFFSRSMEHVAIAKALFSAHLQPTLQQYVDFESLGRQDRKNTDGKLQQRQRDMVYEASMRAQGSLLICTEHQSQAQAILPTRIIRYDADTLEDYARRRLPWPVITNLILYHGEASPYPYPIHPEECYASPALAMEYLSFKLTVIDLNTLSDAAILQGGICAPMELLLKHGRDGIFELEPSAYRQAFQDCVESVGEDYLKTMLDYAQSLLESEVGKRIFEFVSEVLTDKKEAIMTYGQVLEKKGEKRGIQQGIQTRNVEIAKTMLADRTPIDQVRKWTGLDIACLQALLKELSSK